MSRHKAATVKEILLAATALMLPAAPAAAAAAAERDEVVKVVRQWVDGWNKGDLERALVTCARETTIVDEYPPYHWSGEGACRRWINGLVAFNKSIGLTDGYNKLRAPRRVDITGDDAYVVVPADFTYKLKGKKGAEIGALFTTSLHKQAEGWRITGWAWSRP